MPAPDDDTTIPDQLTTAVAQALDGNVEEANAFQPVGEASKRVIDNIRVKMAEGKIYMGAPVYFPDIGRNQRRVERQRSVFK